MKRQWLEEFKIAIVNEQFEEIETLLRQPLSFDNIDQMIEASALIQTALDMVQKERNKTQKLLQATKQQLSFLENSNDQTTLNLSL